MYDYTAWFPNLLKKVKLKLQATENKSMRFCLPSDKMSRTCAKEFIKLNCPNVDDRYLQFILSDIFRLYNNQCPDYFNEGFFPADNNCCSHVLL